MSPKKPKKHTPKSTQAVVITRVNEVTALYLEGKTRSDIVQYAAEHNWNIESRQIDVYISKAVARISEQSNRTTKELKELIEKRLFDLSLKAEAFGQVGVSRRCLMDVARINKIDQNTVIIKQERNLVNLDDSELNDIIEVESHERASD